MFLECFWGKNLILVRVMRKNLPGERFFELSLKDSHKED